MVETLPRLARPMIRHALVGVVVVLAAGCATGSGPEGRRARPPVFSEPSTLPPALRPDAKGPTRPDERADGPRGAAQTGKASWYGNAHHGKKTASGEIYDMDAMTAAHRTLPLGTKVRVTNVDNGKSVVVRINDRGPFIRGRVIDLSRAAARELAPLATGVLSVRIEVLEDAAETIAPSSGR